MDRELTLFFVWVLLKIQRKTLCAAIRGRKFYERNTDLTKSRSLAWNAEHPEKRRVSQSLWNQNRANSKAARGWYYLNRPKLNDQMRVRKAERRKTDPDFKCRELLRSRLRKALFGSLKSERTLDLLGCSSAELVVHLEKQFRPGMSWSNHGPVWHIDHIKPCAQFDLSNHGQQRACFHYSNLQPLFAEENLRKGAR